MTEKIKEETYRHIVNLWWCSLLLGIWCIVAFISNNFDAINSIKAWNNLYPVVFPLMSLLSIFGLLMTSQYRLCVKYKLIKLEKP